MDYRNYINEYINLEIETLKRVDQDALNDGLNLIHETYEKEGRVYIFGNGGSSATASHYVNDFNRGLSEHTEKKFHFICLNDNVATLMAIANDFSFEDVFQMQLEGNLKEEDIVIAISGSGNSKNIIKAVEYAKQCGNKVIGLTGFDGGKLKGLSDINLHVNVNSMQVTEDIHMVFDHLMMSVFYMTMCGINHLKGC